MSTPSGEKNEIGGIELAERAVHLLRTAPLQVWTWWLVGTPPFVIALLVFWSEWASAPASRTTAIEQSLGLALAYVWMKYCQALFSIRLRDLASRVQPRALSFGAHLDIFAIQALVQPTGLFLLPLSTIAVIPFPWVYTFFQSISVQARAGLGLRAALRAATISAGRDFNRSVRLIALMMLFGIFVFLNWLSAGVVLPALLNTLTGYQSSFTMNAAASLNSTFFSIIFALTYLTMNPLMKAMHVLRCFHVDSVRTGEDLLADLRLNRGVSRAPAILLIGFLFIGSAFAQPIEPRQSPGVQKPEASVQGVNPASLDLAIQDVLKQSKYSWREPRERIETEDGFFAQFFKDAWGTIRKVITTVWDWLKWLLEKLMPEHSRRSGSKSTWGFLFSPEVLLCALLAIVAAALSVALLRWRRARRTRTTATALPSQPMPDLQNENVGPEQLPEDGWVKLGRDLLAKGEYRLAMRAFYLSNLVLLAEQKLITLARHKSNRDYERELTRRAHQSPSLLALFGSNVRVFESAWYGSFMPDEPAVLRFAEAVQQMRGGA